MPHPEFEWSQEKEKLENPIATVGVNNAEPSDVDVLVKESDVLITVLGAGAW